MQHSYPDLFHYSASHSTCVALQDLCRPSFSQTQDHEGSGGLSDPSSCCFPDHSSNCALRSWANHPRANIGWVKTLFWTISVVLGDYLLETTVHNLDYTRHFSQSLHAAASRRWPAMLTWTGTTPWVWGRGLLKTRMNALIIINSTGNSNDSYFFL